MNWVLRLRAVSVAFVDGQSRRQVLNQVSLTVGPGEAVALRGPSGSGKTTLLNVAAALLPADGGTVELATPDGIVELGRLSTPQRTALRRDRMGYVFQFFNLVPTLTVRENVLLPLELTGRRELVPRALARLSALGLDGRTDDFPETLSGGERQRVAVARALAHQPLLVLADEPTGNLDADNAAGVAEVLWREVREAGCALVLATHDDAVAERADRVLDLAPRRPAVVADPE